MEVATGTRAALTMKLKSQTTVRILLFVAFTGAPFANASKKSCTDLLNYEKRVPFLLEEEAKPIPAKQMWERLPFVLEHQNSLRSKLGLALLETDISKIAKYPPNQKLDGAISVASVDFKYWTSIEIRGTVAIINDFDDVKFLNHVYVFKNQAHQAYSLAQYALGKAANEFVPIFRYMGKNEYDLWSGKRLENLLTHKPGGEGTWGFDELVTHVSPFKPWEGANLSPETRCGFWNVPKGKLLEWADKKKLVFGLTGKKMSQDYEMVILSSVRKELVAFDFTPCL